MAHESNKGHLKCVHKLLQLGADPTIYSYDYYYPFDLAQNAGYSDVTQTEPQDNFIYDLI